MPPPPPPQTKYGFTSNVVYVLGLLFVLFIILALVKCNGEVLKCDLPLSGGHVHVHVHFVVHVDSSMMHAAFHAFKQGVTS